MLHIFDKYINGQPFVVKEKDTNVEYTCIGYAENETYLIVGMRYDEKNKYTKCKTFKLTDVCFKNNITNTKN